MDTEGLLALVRQAMREEGFGAVGVVGYKEAARRLDVSVRTIKRMVVAGDLLVTKIGRTPKISLSEIKRACEPRAQPETATTRRPTSRGQKKEAKLGAARLRAFSSQSHKS